MQSLEEIFPTVPEGSLLDGTAPKRILEYWNLADPDRFIPVQQTPRWSRAPAA